MIVRKERVRIGKDPNNTRWSRDETSFGQRVLRAQGWQPGDVLGDPSATHAGMHSKASTSHIRVTLKDDQGGLGYRVSTGAGGDQKDDAVTGMDVLKDIFGRLNGGAKSAEQLAREQRERERKEAMVYLGQKGRGVLFIRGGFLVGDEMQERKAENSLLEEEEEEEERDSDTEMVDEANVSLEKKRKRRDDGDCDSSHSASNSTPKKRKKEKSKRSKSEDRSEEDDGKKEMKKSKSLKKEKKERLRRKGGDDGSDDENKAKKRIKSNKKVDDGEDDRNPEWVNEEEDADTTDKERKKAKKKKAKEERKEAKEERRREKEERRKEKEAKRARKAHKTNNTVRVYETKKRVVIRPRLASHKRPSTLDNTAFRQLFCA